MQRLHEETGAISMKKDDDFILVTLAQQAHKPRHSLTNRPSMPSGPVWPIAIGVLCAIVLCYFASFLFNAFIK